MLGRRIETTGFAPMAQILVELAITPSKSRINRFSRRICAISLTVNEEKKSGSD